MSCNTAGIRQFRQLVDQRVWTTNALPACTAPFVAQIGRGDTGHQFRSGAVSVFRVADVRLSGPDFNGPLEVLREFAAIGPLGRMASAQSFAVYLDRV